MAKLNSTSMLAEALREECLIQAVAFTVWAAKFGANYTDFCSKRQISKGFECLRIGMRASLFSQFRLAVEHLASCLRLPLRPYASQKFIKLGKCFRHRAG